MQEDVEVFMHYFISKARRIRKGDSICRHDYTNPDLG
jgi:hypothetical protein